MTLEDAINTSLIHAARGFDADGNCVVSVAYYGDELTWLPGFGGNWAKNWAAVKDEDMQKLRDLDFRPSGPKPEEQIEQEIVDAITEIHEDEDEFSPIGEMDE